MNALLALTMGDACGIGPEILAKVFLGARSEARGAFVLGDLAVMRRAAALCGAGLLPVAQIESPADALRCPPGCVPVLPAAGLPPHGPATPGSETT